MPWVWAQNICHHLPLHPPKKSQLTSSLPLSTTHNIHQWIPDTNQYTTVKKKNNLLSIEIPYKTLNTISKQNANAGRPKMVQWTYIICCKKIRN
jgi:hypothetical protein